MIPHLRHLPYEEKLAKLRLWSLEDKRIRSYLLEVYKMTHSLSSTRMWANAQHNGRPAEYRWRSLFDAAKFR